MFQLTPLIHLSIVRLAARKPGYRIQTVLPYSRRTKVVEGNGREALQEAIFAVIADACAAGRVPLQQMYVRMAYDARSTIIDFDILTCEAGRVQALGGLGAKL